MFYTGVRVFSDSEVAQELEKKLYGIHEKFWHQHFWHRFYAEQPGSMLARI